MKRKPEVGEMLGISMEQIIYSGSVINNSRAQVMMPRMMVSERFLDCSTRRMMFRTKWRERKSSVDLDFLARDL